ncbi:MAG: hypothetical protein GXO37_01755 [Chloroflexi bacterium]|nr:hypothetical protein [Chloroflexota bacterium]
MNLSWWLWTLALLLAGWSAWLLRTRISARRWAVVGLFLVVAAFPVLDALGRVWIARLYADPTSDWAARLMPSRQVLPVTHYQARWEQVLLRVAVAAAAVLFVWALATVVRSAPGRWRRVLRRPGLRRVGIGLLVGLVAFVGYNAWLHVQFLQPHPVFYTGCRKVWGHRGHPEPPDIPENTIASYARAFDLGAAGVEMDVRYDPQRREYFVGRYDRGQDPPPEQRLRLDEVFAAVGSRGYFWLDIKTIAYLTPAQARQAAADLAALLDRHHLRSRAIVESDTPSNLAYFAQAGLHTSYWIFNLDEDDFPSTPWALWWALTRIKQNYIQGGFSAISLDRRFYTPTVAWMLRGARIHLFTVNERRALEALVAQEPVRVILTDTAYYDITACP